MADGGKPRATRPALKLGALDGVLGFHVRMAAAAIYRDFVASMAGLDLTQKQFAVLELIACNDGVAQTDLAATLGTDRATMMALIDRLEARGLMERRPSARDGRRQVLSLSAGGARTLAAAHAAVAAHEQRFTACYRPDELAQLVGGLRRIYGAD